MEDTIIVLPLKITSISSVQRLPLRIACLRWRKRRRHTRDGGTPSLLPQADGEDAEQADDDAENRHGAVAFAEADGGI